MRNRLDLILGMNSDRRDQKRAAKKTFTVDEFFTRAVRLQSSRDIDPQEGFMRSEYQAENQSIPSTPVFMVAVARRRMFDLFFTLLKPLGDRVGVALDLYHNVTQNSGHDTYRVDEVDTSVAMSAFAGYEDLLLHDGCTGVSVWGRRPEIQWSRQKLIYCYGTEETMGRFHGILHGHRIPYTPDFQIINDVPHTFQTIDDHRTQFRELTECLHAEKVEE